MATPGEKERRIREVAGIGERMESWPQILADVSGMWRKTWAGREKHESRFAMTGERTRNETARMRSWRDAKLREKAKSSEIIQAADVASAMVCSSDGQWASQHGQDGTGEVRTSALSKRPNSSISTQHASYGRAP